MSIPSNIFGTDILEVILKIDEGSLLVPAKQRSTKYCLFLKGRNYLHYPPKYLIRQANKMVNGEELWTHSGGVETNSFCEKRGFRLLPHGGAPHP